LCILFDTNVTYKITQNVTNVTYKITQNVTNIWLTFSYGRNWQSPEIELKMIAYMSDLQSPENRDHIYLSDLSTFV
jgi:hypothetical protein